MAQRASRLCKYCAQNGAICTERPKDGRAMSEPKKDGDGLRGRDQQQGDLRDEGGDRDLPEGLKRDRKGPVSKQGGRSARQD